MNKILLSALFILAVSPSALGQTANFWISQNGSGTQSGADSSDTAACDATPSTPQTQCAAFVNAANWGTGSGQIGAGTTIHVTGTITGSAADASLYFDFQGGGSSGSPIVFLADSTTNLTSPSWALGVIDTEGFSYITINGGATGTLYSGSITPGSLSGGGIIQATNNGTALTYQNSAVGIMTNGGSNIIIENWTIANLYVHTCTPPNTNCPDNNGANSTGVYVLNGDSVTVQNNVVHDARWAVDFGSDGTGITQTGITFKGNHVYNIDHGMTVAFGVGTTDTGTGFNVFDNYIHDFQNWDTASDAFHHDCTHFWSYSGSSLTINDYNNFCYGNQGQNVNTELFFQHTAGSPYGTLNCNVFNNVIFTNNYGGDGAVLDSSSSGCASYNNTIMQGGWFSQVQDSGGTVLYNNLFGTPSGQYIGANNSGLISVSDYQDFWPQTTGAIFITPATSYVDFAGWQAAGFDAHSLNTPANLTTGYVPSYSSPVYQAGKNLYSICNGQPSPGLGDLCKDVAGNARPSTGGWDMGAFNAQAGLYVVATTTGTFNTGSGTVSASTSYAQGSPFTVTATPNSGSALVGFGSLCGAGTVTGNTFTGTTPGNNCMITAYFDVGVPTSTFDGLNMKGQVIQ